MNSFASFILTFVPILAADPAIPAKPLEIPANEWIKLSPLPSTPPSPRLGYEGACVWDARNQLFLRYGGHNQGGGGEQGSEVWTFEPRSARWNLLLPNTSPPGVCCDQQNVFDETSQRYLRFPSFSGSHGWQWFREIYLNDSTIWMFDVPTNQWKNLRPWPNPSVHPLRCASWDSDFQVAVVFGGEGSNEGTLVYDPLGNNWLRMKPAKEPAGRSGGNMTYDAAAKRHVLFGSQFNDDPHTWTYNLRTNTWEDMKPATMPPTNKNDAVLAYDARSQRVVALVKISTGEGENEKHEIQTWIYHTAKNEWKQAKPPAEPDVAGNRTRQLTYAPQLGAILLENRPSNTSRKNAGKDPEQQIYAYRAAELKPASEPLPLATNVKLTAGDGNKIQISWAAATDPRVKRWRVERGQGEQVWKADWVPIAGLLGTTLSYVDEPGQSAGGVLFYSVHASDEEGKLLGPPTMVRTQPKFVEEVVVSVQLADRVEISWKAPDDKRIIGYHVERAPVEVLSDDQLVPLKRQTPPLDPPSIGGVQKVGLFTRLTTTPLADTSFIDTQVKLSEPSAVDGPTVNERKFSAEHLDSNGTPYLRGVFAYRVLAVNRRGEFSGPSPGVLTVPSMPQHLFAKEEGTKCHLKWKPNPETHIAGYRVYRMDGRFKEAKIQRLTPQPIKGTEFTDPDAGTATRRYYVVPVDTFGQEGHPSAPVWFQREWQDFYKTFQGEWHQ